LIAPLLWTGFLWALLGFINPALNARVDWGWFIASQIAFGLATGYVVSRSHPVATMQTWPLAARAGVQAAGPGPEEEGKPSGRASPSLPSPSPSPSPHLAA